MKLKTIHPFPARMAPDLALKQLRQLPPGSTVLDPMSGSGVVLRHAAELGHHGIGFDMDPLAVLMTSVWTAPVDDAAVGDAEKCVLGLVRTRTDRELPWMDDDAETTAFVKYWFAAPQRKVLRGLAWALHRMPEKAEFNVLRLALSRIIITKDSGASLARDVSHSRPHRVARSSSYDVIAGFKRSVLQVRRMLLDAPPPGEVQIHRGDARLLSGVPDASIGAILTSPPYLNAIDYMRGHRLSLVWLGHALSDLRTIRSSSIGAERGPDLPSGVTVKRIVSAMSRPRLLDPRTQRIAERYSADLIALMVTIRRVLSADGQAILVVGNSCIRGVFVRNSDATVAAAEEAGLRLVHRSTRRLPSQNRYLPTPQRSEDPLAKRIRTESILSFAAS